MKRTINLLFALLTAIVSLPSCTGSNVEKPKYLWMCIDANFERFSHKDSICYYLDKAKETGFNQVVVDVRGVDGLVLYESDILPKLVEVDGFRCERDWDYLQYFLDQAKERGLKVTVSATVFPAGSQYHDRGLVFEDPSVAEMTCVEYTPSGMMKIEDDESKVAAFLNPVLPQAREHAMSVIRELLTKYDFDGYCLDYCRFPDGQSDFSQATREAFEKYIGEEVENFPQDIYSYAEDGSRVPGKFYKKWWEFRSMVIRDFIADVRKTVDDLQPDVKLEYWAASWLHAIYQNGQNWASPQSRFYEAYLDDWATPDYYKTAFADQLDVFITGTYLEKVWGMDDLESIEYGLYRSNRDVQGACAVYGSLYAQNHLDEFDDAVYLCLRDTEGLMVFDLVQVIRYNLWDKIKKGIDRAESEIK